MVGVFGFAACLGWIIFTAALCATAQHAAGTGPAAVTFFGSVLIFGGLIALIVLNSR